MLKCRERQLHLLDRRFLAVPDLALGHILVREASVVFAVASAPAAVPLVGAWVGLGQH